MASKTNTTASLDRARTDLAAIETDLAAMQRKRQARLLAGDTASAFSKIDLELEALQQAARTETDRIAALEEQGLAEEAAAADQARLGRIASVEGMFERRTEKAERFEQLLGEALGVLREMAADNAAIDAAWSFEYHDRGPAILPIEHLLDATRVHIFRLSTPAVTGRQGAAGTAVDLPGGRCPRPLEWAGTPEKAASISSAMREAAKFASQIMRTGISSSGRPATFSDGIPSYALKDKPPLSPNQQRLAQLLKQQMDAANDVSPEGDARYSALMAEITQVQSEIMAQTGSNV